MITYQKYAYSAHVDKAKIFFKELYPDWTDDQINRLLYDEKQRSHVVTLVALSNDNIIGQINMFKVGDTKKFSNLGYHVAKNFQGHGVGTELVKRIITYIKNNKINTRLLVQTTNDNSIAIALAKKFGFNSVISNSFDSLDKKYLKYLKIDNGICLYLDL